MNCIIGSCSNPGLARQMCGMHYARWTRNNDDLAMERPPQRGGPLTHGMSYSREYCVWRNMLKRCLDPSHKGWHNYGGKGVKVCDRWLHSFENFYEDVGPRPKGYQLDRINSNGNYCPENCRWTDLVTQRRNSKNIRPITVDGETKLMHEWAATSGIKIQTIRARLDRYGWDVKDAIFTPPTPRNERRRYRLDHPKSK